MCTCMAELNTVSDFVAYMSTIKAFAKVFNFTHVHVIMHSYLSKNNHSPIGVSVLAPFYNSYSGYAGSEAQALRFSRRQIT